MASSTRPASRADAACSENCSNVALGLELLSGRLVCPRAAPAVKKAKKRASEKQQYLPARSIHIMTDPARMLAQRFAEADARIVADSSAVVKTSSAFLASTQISVLS